MNRPKWLFETLLLPILACLLSGCQGAPGELSVLSPDGNYYQIPVFYATNRRDTGSFASPAERFGKDEGPINYGVMQISIPVDHRMGELESPRWWRLEFRPDPEKHVVLLSLDVLSEPSFFGRLRERIDMSPQRSALVFIHGYNVSFEDAARRTGQLAYDLNFQGAPILYSWPSQDSYWRYPMDATYAERTVPHMERFLADVALRSGADTIHVIAHSLGNRPLVNALARIAGQKGSGGKPLFNEIILTAPDIDADVFVDLAARIAGVGERVTLYASGKDGALNFSKWFNGLPRAGDTSEGVVIVEGVDTIDASSVDTSLMGHSYYRDNRSVISDIYWTIKAKPVSERHGIRPSIFREQRYWLFQP